MYMFVFAATANTTYALSIVLKSTEAAFLANALPYLLGR